MGKKKKGTSSKVRGNPPVDLSQFSRELSRLVDTPAPRWPMMVPRVEVVGDEEDDALAFDVELAKHLVNRLTEAIARAEERK